MKYAPGSAVELSVRDGASATCSCSGRSRPGSPPRTRTPCPAFQRIGDPSDGLSSGLGVSLARQIVVGAGGRLWYEDREGGGARFVIELPQGGNGEMTV